jgi:hypothetical protein
MLLPSRRTRPRGQTMPDADEDDDEPAPALDLVNALCTTVAVLAACGLIWVALTWEPMR